MARIICNPLDPFAYDQEPRPFTPGRTPTTREQQLGVHTTTQERAVVYAVQRASQTVTPLKDEEPNCGIILALDASGLTPLPDTDAALKASWETETIKELLREPIIIKAIQDNDAETLAEEIHQYLDRSEYQGDGYLIENWFEGVWQQQEIYQQSSILSVLDDLDPDELLTVMTEALTTDEIPLEYWMEATEQRRYMAPFGLDRVVSIQAVRPVRPELWGHSSDDPENALKISDYPEDDPDQPQIFSDVSIWEDDWLPDLATLWNNPDLTEATNVEYHGTDITRTKQAFPQLAEILVSPWPYTQE